MRLSIIIPTYNEEKTISALIKKVRSIKLTNPKEIIVVDDGSTDSTSKLLKDISGIKKIRHIINLGKGAAIRSGLKQATGDIILIQDADLEYNPKDYTNLLEPLIKKECDVVYGNRFPLYLGSRLNLNYFGNRLLTLLTRILYGSSIEDMETGYKVFRKEVLNKINLKAKRFDFEPEITAKLLKRRCKIEEVPIHYNPRSKEEGKKITLLDGVKAAFYLLKYRFMD